MNLIVWRKRMDRKVVKKRTNGSFEQKLRIKVKKVPFLFCRFITFSYLCGYNKNL